MKIFEFMIKVNVRLNIQVEREDNSTEAREEFDTILEEIINEVELLYSPISSCLSTHAKRRATGDLENNETLNWKTPVNKPLPATNVKVRQLG